MIRIHCMYEMSAASDSTKLVRMFRSNLTKFIDYCLNNEVVFSPTVTTRVLSELPSLLPDYHYDSDFWSDLQEVFLKCAVGKPQVSVVKREIENSDLDDDSKSQLRHLLDIAIGWKKRMPQSVSSSPSEDPSDSSDPSDLGDYRLVKKPYVRIDWCDLCESYEILDPPGGMGPGGGRNKIAVSLEEFMSQDLGLTLPSKYVVGEEPQRVMCSHRHRLARNEW